MARVKLTVSGDARGGVSALKQVLAATGDLKEASQKTAAEQVAARAKEREALTQLAAEYRAVAKTAVSGSKEQVAAIELARNAERQLGIETQRQAGILGVFRKQTGGAGDDVGRFARGALAGSGAAKALGRQVAFASGSFIGAAGLVGALVSTAKAAGDLQTELNTFQAVTKATGNELDEARKKAVALGDDLSIPNASAADAAQAMTELAKGGLDVKESMAAAKGTLQLAAAAQTDNATAATIVARALNAFSLQGKDAVKVADLLAGAANASTGDMSDFALGLAQAGAQAHLAGLTIDETVTALAELANAGIVGSDAGTSLRVMLQRLNPTSKQAKELIAHLGLSVYDATGKMLPLRDIVAKYSKVLDELNPKQRTYVLNTIFGQDASRAAAIVLGGETKAYDSLNKAVTRHGQASEVAGAKTKGFNGAVSALGNAIQTLQVQVGTTLDEAVTKDIKSLANWVSHLNDGDRAVKAVGGAIGALKTVLHDAKVAIDAVDKATGGFKQTLELLIAPKVASVVASKLTGWASGFKALIGTEAAAGAAGGAGLAGAAGSAGTLLTRLRALAALSPLTVSVLLTYTSRGEVAGSKQQDQFLQGMTPTSTPGVYTSHGMYFKMVGGKITQVAKPAAGDTGPALQSRVPIQGKSVQVPTSFTATHQTAGLAGFPAVDLFANPGTKVLAPEDGQVSRISGREPSQAPPDGAGGPWGLSLYFLGAESGNTYYLTHLAKVAEPGSYRKGDVIAIIGNYPGSTPDHVHVGIHKGKSPEAFVPSGLFKPSDYLSRPSRSKPTSKPTPGGSGHPHLGDGNGGKHAGVKIPKVSAAIQSALGRAAGTAGLADDIKANQDAVDYLSKLLDKTTDKDVKAGLETAIGRYKKAILEARHKLATAAAAETKREHQAAGVKSAFAGVQGTLSQAFHLDLLPASEEAKLKGQESRLAQIIRKALKDGKVSTADVSKINASWKAMQSGISDAEQAVAQHTKDVFDRAWQGVTTTVTRAIDEQWQQTVTQFQRDSQAGVDRIQAAAAADIQGMQRDFQRQLAQFDRETQAGRDAISAKYGAPTPTEALITQLQDEHDQQAQQAQLAADQAAGDTKAVAEDLYQIKLAGLQKQAHAERKAANEQEQTAQDAYQQQRDDLRQSLQDAETARENARQTQADNDAQTYQDQRDAQLQHLTDMHDDQMTALNNDLSDWQQWLFDKQKSYADFLSWLAQNPVSAAVAGQAPTAFSGFGASAVSVGGAPSGSLAAQRYAAAHVARLGFASGGKVPGRYVGMDDTLIARVTPGEEIIDRSTAKMLRAALAAGDFGGSRQVVVEVNVDRRKVATLFAKPVTAAQRRQISYPHMRA